MNHSSTKSIAVIGEVGLPQRSGTGGALRSTRSIREYSKHFDVYYFLLPTQSTEPEILRYLKEELKIKEVVELTTPLKPILGNARLSFLYPLMTSNVLKILVKGFNRVKIHPEGIVVLNEPLHYLSVGRLLKEKFHIPSIALFQLPLMHADKKRQEKIKLALTRWYEELYAEEELVKIIRKLRTSMEFQVACSKFVKDLIKSYDMLIAISRSIVIEMGEAFSDKFYVLDPGVSLDQEDMELINRVKGTRLEKRNHVVLGGRVDALKGFVEGVYAFKELSRRDPKLKLVVTGYISDPVKWRIERFLKRLGLKDKVVLTGFLPRLERFKVISEAKLMLYPSHVDAFPYAVLEALHLNTPVVGYDIPALKIHYGNCPGVTMVEEGDVEALVSKAMDVMNIRDMEVRPPILPSWDEVIKKELSIIKRVLR